MAGTLSPLLLRMLSTCLPRALCANPLPLIQATGPTSIPSSPCQDRNGSSRFVALLTHILSGRAQHDDYPPSLGIFAPLLTCCVTPRKSLSSLVSAFSLLSEWFSRQQRVLLPSDVCCSNWLLLHDKLSPNLVANNPSPLPAHSPATWAGPGWAVSWACNSLTLIRLRRGCIVRGGLAHTSGS